MDRPLLKAWVLVIASSAAGLFVNAVRAKPLPWVIDTRASVNPGENKELAARVEMTLDEVLEHLRNGTGTLVDARKPEQFAEGHVAGAINIPSTEKEQHIGKAFAMLPRDGVIIIYCDGGNCEASNDVFAFLAGAGFDQQNLRIFKPGWEVLGRRADVPILYGVE